MLANHNRHALFDITKTDETVKIPWGFMENRSLF